MDEGYGSNTGIEVLGARERRASTIRGMVCKYCYNELKSVSCSAWGGMGRTYSVIEHVHCTATCSSPNTAPKAAKPLRFPLLMCSRTGSLFVGHA